MTKTGRKTGRGLKPPRAKPAAQMPPMRLVNERLRSPVRKPTPAPSPPPEPPPMRLVNERLRLVNERPASPPRQRPKPAPKPKPTTRHPVAVGRAPTPRRRPLPSGPKLEPFEMFELARQVATLVTDVVDRIEGPRRDEGWALFDLASTIAPPIWQALATGNELERRALFERAHRQAVNCLAALDNFGDVLDVGTATTAVRTLVGALAAHVLSTPFLR